MTAAEPFRLKSFPEATKLPLMTLSFLPLPPGQILSHATESIPSGETYLNSPLGASTRQPRCLVTSCSKAPQVLGSTEPLSTPSRLGLYSCPAFLIGSSQLVTAHIHTLITQ